MNKWKLNGGLLPTPSFSLFFFSSSGSFFFSNPPHFSLNFSFLLIAYISSISSACYFNLCCIIIWLSVECFELMNYELWLVAKVFCFSWILSSSSVSPSLLSSIFTLSFFLFCLSSTAYKFSAGLLLSSCWVFDTQ